METSGKVHQESHPFGGGFFCAYCGAFSRSLFCSPPQPRGEKFNYRGSKKGQKKTLPILLASSSSYAYEGYLVSVAYSPSTLQGFCRSPLATFRFFSRFLCSASGMFSAKRSFFAVSIGRVLVATQPNGYSVVNFGVSPCHPFGLYPV